MAKGKYEKWLEPENLVRLHGWKLQGLTDEQIADKIGIAHRTFERWKKEHSQIRQAIKGGKEVATFIIENELFKKAKSGNVVAMIFWLKNNYREKYSDNPKTELDIELTKANVEQIKAESSVAKANAEIVEAKLADLEDDKDDQMDALNNMMSKLAKNIPKDDQNDD